MFWNLRAASLAFTVIVVSALSGGCGNSSSSSLVAQAPGSNHPITAKTPTDGQYTLYRVTRFNGFGQPLDSKAIATYHLPRGEPIGFRWVSERAQNWHPHATLLLQAYAGDHEEDLGPITSTTEKYFWANPDNWKKYWTMRPGYAIEQRITRED